MASISVSRDSKSALVGPGARWIDVYQYLDPLKLTAIGGRVETVGVSGLILGGGISFFSARHGFACDNVDEFEVVIASGEIVTASPSRNPDLFYALRGGGSSNFGIVTRFSLATYSQGNLWGGYKIYPITLNKTILAAFTEYNTNNPNDKNAHLILPFVYAAPLGGWATFAFIDYAIPTPDPPIYDAFKRLPDLASTMRITTVSDLALELNQGTPAGKRQLFRTFSFRNDADLAVQIWNLCYQKFSPLQDRVTTITCAFQPLPVNYIQPMQRNGGNALGLEPDDGPLVIINVAVEWLDSAADRAVERAIKEFIDDGVRLAKRKRLDHPFIYINYAGPDQDVQAGYGRDNLRRLRQVREKYDPRGFWKRNWPGYHKL